MGFEQVSEEKHRELRRRMLKNRIYEKDILEAFVRSSGPGGQNINKISSCVVLVHGPSGTRVKCQKFRFQGQNRYEARCLLVEKIVHKRDELLLERRQAKEKKKRQNRKRPARLKEKILEKKHYQSQKKDTRRKIRLHRLNDY